MSLGSVVYFFKAGVCFLISKALLCSFPNKALKNPPLPHPSLFCPPKDSSPWKNVSHNTSRGRGGPSAGVLHLWGLCALCALG